MPGIVNKLSICKQCTTPIARGADCIACEGFCRNAFHAGCVKLSDETLASCRTNPNVWWICDPCTDLMRDIRNDRLLRANRTEDNTTSPKAVENLPSTNVDPVECTSENECENTTIRDIMDELFTIKQQMAVIRDSVNGVFSQREARMESCMGASSSPLSSTRLMQGSKR